MRSLVLGTAGHIDHGKSALVLALTGIDPDRLKEEKARGITIDLGFAHAAMGDVDVSFVDVPGHERFVRTMLAGAGGFDAVVLVIAADESVMPQTREHLAICRLIGIERGIIALTKVDLADADTRAVVALEIRSLVAGTFLEAAPILPVSARTGEGLEALRTAIASLAGGPPRLGRGGLVRLPVDRTFSVKGFGTVATGTLVSGAIAKGDELEVLPLARRVRVRGVQVHGRDAPAARAPQRTAVNLAAVEVADLGRGVTLATPGAFGATRRVDARIQTAAIDDRQSPRARPIIRHGSRVRLYQGTSEIPARVAIVAVRSGRDQNWSRVTAADTAAGLQPGGEAFVRLQLERPAVLARLDRIVLRGGSPATTVGGGIVLDVEPPVAGLRRPATLQRFEALDAAGGAGDASVDRLKAVVTLWLTEAGDTGLDVPRIARRSGVDTGTATDVIAALDRDGTAQSIDDRVFAKAVAQRILAAQRAARSAATPAPLADNERRDRDRVEVAFRDARLMPPEPDDLARSLTLTRAEIDRLTRDLVRAGLIVRSGTLHFHRDALGELKVGVRALAAETPGEARLDVASFKTHYGLSRKFAIPLLEWLDRERVTRRVGESRIVIASSS